MKNTNYCIIDHVGKIEDNEALKACYALAEKIREHDKDKTYKMKAFTKLVLNLQKDPNKGQKFIIRHDKHPEEVIFICDKYNTTTKWVADIWAEKVETLKIIEAANYDTVNDKYLTMEDIHPEWFETHYITEDSKYRRCASIWAKPLGWTFLNSNPLYRDDDLNPEGFHRVKSNSKQLSKEEYLINQKKEAELKITFLKNCPKEWNKKQKETAWEKRIGAIKHEAWKQSDKRNTTSKISSRPASYLKAKAIASEEECKKFFEYYKYLYLTGTLEDSLEPGYQLCPHCGKPIAIDKAEANLKELDPSDFKDASEFHPRKNDRTCSYCQLLVPAELLNSFNPYYDDSYEDESEGYLDDMQFNTYFDSEEDNYEDWD